MPSSFPLAALLGGADGRVVEHHVAVGTSATQTIQEVRRQLPLITRPRGTHNAAACDDARGRCGAVGVQLGQQLEARLPLAVPLAGADHGAIRDWRRLSGDFDHVAEQEKCLSQLAALLASANRCVAGDHIDAAVKRVCLPEERQRPLPPTRPPQGTDQGGADALVRLDTRMKHVLNDHQRVSPHARQPQRAEYQSVAFRALQQPAPAEILHEVGEHVLIMQLFEHLVPNVLHGRGPQPHRRQPLQQAQGRLHLPGFPGRAEHRLASHRAGHHTNASHLPEQSQGAIPPLGFAACADDGVASFAALCETSVAHVLDRHEGAPPAPLLPASRRDLRVVLRTSEQPFVPQFGDGFQEVPVLV
mmetsp:Transcript_57717/g.160871  ORF Transcript_57717/g.160871 Transcript_57717/m.160871 type:complete len:360 (+) Transcript_57717:556-1635(+)